MFQEVDYYFPLFIFLMFVHINNVNLLTIPSLSRGTFRNFLDESLFMSPSGTKLLKDKNLFLT